MDEFDLIKKMIRPSSDPSVQVSVGDDCSVQLYDDGHFMISTTDCLIENVHFRLSDINFSELGYKSLAVNISDISAMGGNPLWAHMTLGIPKSFSENDVSLLFEGFYHLAEPLGISLIGGDISRSPEHFFINIHLSGLVSTQKIQLRENFSQAEVLCVTGMLGDSAAGLECLLKDIKGPFRDELVKQHKLPPVQIKKAQWLVEQGGVFGMMDLSDGLVSDLQRLPKDMGISIQLEHLPHSNSLLEFCAITKDNPLKYSLAGGEDYVLLFGCTENSLFDLQSRFLAEFGEEFYAIGNVDEGEKGIVFLNKGKPQTIPFTGFKHF